MWEIFVMNNDRYCYDCVERGYCTFDKKQNPNKTCGFRCARHGFFEHVMFDAYVDQKNSDRIMDAFYYFMKRDLREIFNYWRK